MILIPDYRVQSMLGSMIYNIALSLRFFLLDMTVIIRTLTVVKKHKQIQQNRNN